MGKVVAASLLAQNCFQWAHVSMSGMAAAGEGGGGGGAAVSRGERGGLEEDAAPHSPAQAQPPHATQPCPDSPGRAGVES